MIKGTPFPTVKVLHIKDIVMSLTTENAQAEQGEFPDQLHPSHKTEIALEASSYDEICVNCRATDLASGGWGKLRFPCPAAVKTD